MAVVAVEEECRAAVEEDTYWGLLVVEVDIQPMNILLPQCLNKQ